MRSRRWAFIPCLMLLALTLPLVTATPLLADETFGVESPGSNDYPSGTAGRTTQGSQHASLEGWLEANRIAIPAGGCFVTHVNVALETGGGSIRYAIYDDTGGNPGSLVSGTVIGPVTPSSGWNKFAFDTPVFLEEGDYWLARQSENTTPRRYYDASGGDGRVTRSFSWGEFPTTFGTPGQSDNLDNSHYVDYVVAQYGVAKATKAMLADDNSSITSVSFYSHAEGNVRLAIYSDGTSPTDLLWESGSTTVLADDWTTVDISEGTPTSLTLDSGTYWLAWQWDSQNPGPGLTLGDAGDGYYVSHVYGGFPDPWGSTPSDETWGIYASYTSEGQLGSPTSTTMPVGGGAYAPNKLALVAPWFAAIAAIAGGAAMLSRRRNTS